MLKRFEARVGVSLGIIAIAACGRTPLDTPQRVAIADGGASASTTDGAVDVVAPSAIDASIDAAIEPTALAFTDDAELIAVSAGGVYFTSHTEPSVLRYVASDGTIFTASDLPGVAVALAIDATTVYAAVNAQPDDSTGAIVAVAIASGTPRTFAAGDTVTGVTVDDDAVYWGAYGAQNSPTSNGVIYRAPKIGGVPAVVATMGADAPGPFALVARDRLTWATGGWAYDTYPPMWGGTFVFDAPKDMVDGQGTRIATPTTNWSVRGFARAGTTTVILSDCADAAVVAIRDGESPQTIASLPWLGAANTAVTIVSDGSRVFWSEPGEHGAVRAWSPGDVAVTTIASDQKYPNALAVYESSVYWTAATGIWSHPK